MHVNTLMNWKAYGSLNSYIHICIMDWAYVSAAAVWLNPDVTKDKPVGRDYWKDIVRKIIYNLIQIVLSYLRELYPLLIMHK